MPNINLIIVKGGSGYCSERLSIGVYVNNGIATLIDSGIDDVTAKAVDKMLKQNGLTLGAIINTHSHADHCGGNNYFQSQYPTLKIYATKYEAHYIEDTINEPRCFCQGAQPLAGLRNKFLEAKGSVVTDVIQRYEDQNINVSGEVFRIITLPGHTPGMIGVITPDNVFYAGDAIFGTETLDKHAVLFYTNIHDTLNSFKKMSELKVDACVFYHGGLLQKDLVSMIVLHENKIKAVQEAIHQLILREPVSIDQLTQQVIKYYKIPENITQFTLTRVCVNAYVAQLEAEKKIESTVIDGMMVVGKMGISADALKQIGQSSKAGKPVTSTTLMNKM